LFIFYVFKTIIKNKIKQSLLFIPEKAKYWDVFYQLHGTGIAKVSNYSLS